MGPLNTKRWIWVAVGVLAGGILGVSGWTLIQDTPAEPAVELELVARGIRYNGDNPLLRLQQGRPVHLVVRNAEPADKPVYHDFAIAGMGVEPTRPLAPGESATLEFTPRQPGTYTYHCPLHPGLMNGRIVVQ